MGARLQSEVSTGKKGKKGAVVQAVGDKPLVTPMGTMLEEHKQADFAGVVSSPKGASLAQEGGRGTPPVMPGSTPLQGHVDHPVGHGARGNSPKRGPGKTATPPSVPKPQSKGKKQSPAGSDVPLPPPMNFRTTPVGKN